MGFGIGSIGDAIKSAVNTVSDAVGGAAQAVGDGVQAAEKKVADVVQSAMEGIGGNDGFDEPVGPLAESKPKGGTGRADAGSSGTAYA
ncbi:MAG TPA: hypothetical protein VIG99_02785 [Myxococcaceae bacterium]|jgi:phage-related protein